MGAGHHGSAVGSRARGWLPPRFQRPALVGNPRVGVVRCSLGCTDRPPVHQDGLEASWRSTCRTGLGTEPNEYCLCQRRHGVGLLRAHGAGVPVAGRQRSACAHRRRNRRRRHAGATRRRVPGGDASRLDLAGVTPPGAQIRAGRGNPDGDRWRDLLRVVRQPAAAQHRRQTSGLPTRRAAGEPVRTADPRGAARLVDLLAGGGASRARRTTGNFRAHRPGRADRGRLASARTSERGVAALRGVRRAVLQLLRPPWPARSAHLQLVPAANGAAVSAGCRGWSGQLRRATPALACRTSAGVAVASNRLASTAVACG